MSGPTVEELDASPLGQALDTAGDLIAELPLRPEFHSVLVGRRGPRLTREATEHAHQLAHGFSLLLSTAELYVPERCNRGEMVHQLRAALEAALAAMARDKDNLAPPTKYDPRKVVLTFNGVQIHGVMDASDIVAVPAKRPESYQRPPGAYDGEFGHQADAAQHAALHVTALSADSRSVEAAVMRTPDQPCTTRQIRARLAKELRPQAGQMLLDELRAGRVVKLKVDGKYTTRANAEALLLDYEDMSGREPDWPPTEHQVDAASPPPIRSRFTPRDPYYSRGGDGPPDPRPEPYRCNVPMCGESGVCAECRKRGAR